MFAFRSTKNGQFKAYFCSAKISEGLESRRLRYVLGNGRRSRQAFGMPEQTISQIKELLVTDESAELGPGPRAGVLSEAALNSKLNSLLAQTELSPTRQQLVRALLLLWHDHLDTSHTISQDIENADGSFVHAIMHRREPDAWNSKYWWRRVGDHPAFSEIANRVRKLLAGDNSDLAKRLMPRGNWDAAGFVDACDSAKDEPLIRTLREVQRVETEVLLEYFCHE